MKNIKYTTIIALILNTFIFNSCSRKHKIKYECTRAEGPHLYFLFEDSLYKTKYPLRNIKVKIIENLAGKDSIITAIIKDSSSINNNQIIGIENMVNFNTIVEFDVFGKKYIFSEFDIQKIRTETLFGGYYETCDIVGCKRNGVKMGNDWNNQIKTGL